MGGDRSMRTLRLMSLWLVVSLSSVGLDASLAADVAVQLKDVKVMESAQGVTVAVETSGPTRYQASVIENPTRLVIDLNGAYAAAKRRWTPTPEPIREIRGSQWKPDTARLVLELSRPVAYRIQEAPSGLSIVLEPSKNGRAEAGKLDVPSKAVDVSAAPEKL